MDARISLTSRISEAGYPDLELSDIYGKKVRLSSLTGKVVLLDFWSAELGNSNTLNAELKEVYKKYADAPTQEYPFHPARRSRQAPPQERSGGPICENPSSATPRG